MIPGVIAALATFLLLLLIERPKGRRGKKIVLVGSVALVAALWSAYDGWQADKREARAALELGNANRSRSLPPPHQPRATVHMCTGEIHLALSPPSQPAFFSTDRPFLVSITPSAKLELRGDVLDSSGRVVAVLQDSSVQLISGLGYDINSDGLAIEVVDPDLNPVFQLWKTGEFGDYWIRSFTFLRGGKGEVAGYEVCAEGRYSRGPVKELRRPSWAALFKYPGFEFPGARRQ